MSALPHGASGGFGGKVPPKKQKYRIQPVSSPGRQGLNTEGELDPQSPGTAAADSWTVSASTHQEGAEGHSRGPPSASSPYSDVSDWTTQLHNSKAESHQPF